LKEMFEVLDKGAKRLKEGKGKRGGNETENLLRRKNELRD